ncbi:tRNA methyltransferase [Mycena floridula]|nr:tRNA methyltransferase [Mycena floridula]
MDEIVVPDGFRLHTENKAHILLASNEAFLNPVQEFNRDLSVACIRVWSEEMNRAKEIKWQQTREKKAIKGQGKRRKVDAESTEKPEVPVSDKPEEPAGEKALVTKKEPQYHPQKIIILEALSATGLRSIRYATEIPLVKYVIANDLSSLATAAMKRNIELNGLGPPPETSDAGKVRVNEGDACSLMYNHRQDKKRVDVVDLDPYGTAAPFIDAAIQCINDGGLLCVTCTDLPVLGTTNYPEKCFSNYGGVSVRSEYCHEAALRLVLHSLSTSASRYGRYVQPILCLSIDFYVRLFVRVHTSPQEVKKALTKTSTFYICTACQSFYEQPFGKMVEKKHEASGNVNLLFKTQHGPPVPNKCPECQSSLYMAGPMWSGPIHDPDFIAKVLEHLSANVDQYGTSARMKGMLTVAQEELEVPFYFTPSRVASFFHCETPSLDEIASALLHAGHQISRSHACPGSLKTTATREQIHDVFRCYIKKHPVKMENMAERTTAQNLLAKEPSTQANFTRHPKSITPSSQVKLVRYQENPTSHWGPGTKADAGTKRKRKGD